LSTRKAGSQSAKTAAVPSLATLKKYGLSLIEWEARRIWQKDACAICKKLPKTGRLCIDHEHVKGWKKMPPEQRVKYVRGLLCWVCNHYYCGRGITVGKAKNLVSYLEGYENAKANRVL
jgi:hypothetical protein